MEFLLNLWKLSEIRTFAADEVILSMGGHTQELFHVMSGRVVAKDAQDNQLREVTSGELFGEQSFLDEHRFGETSSFVATEPTDCMVMIKDSVQTAFESLLPRMGSRFYRALALYSNMRATVRWRLVEQLTGTRHTDWETSDQGVSR